VAVAVAVAVAVPVVAAADVVPYGEAELEADEVEPCDPVPEGTGTMAAPVHAATLPRTEAARTAVAASLRALPCLVPMKSMMSSPPLDPANDFAPSGGASSRETGATHVPLKIPYAAHGDPTRVPASDPHGTPNRSREAR